MTMVFRRMIVVTLAAVLFGGCGTAAVLINREVKPPEMRYRGASLTALTFDSATLTFNVSVTNPNKIGMTLGGFDYDFLIGGATLVTGQSTEPLRLEANAENTVKIPVTIPFEDAYEAVKELVTAREADYRMNAGFTFAVPMLGDMRIPVSFGGKLPLPKRPSIKLVGMNVESMSLSKADITLQVGVDNPNAFSMLLDVLEYNLEVGGKQWASGKTEQQSQIGEQSSGVIAIPISVNALRVGADLFSMLREGQTIDYRLSGNVGFKTSMPLLEKVLLPLNLSESITVGSR